MTRRHCSAERRAGLQKTILWSHCPEAQLKLFDFSNEILDRIQVTRDGLIECAEAVLCAVQVELTSRSSPLELAVASELAISRLWAIHALSVCTGSHAHAKRFELRIAGGAPLAVCVGTGPWFPPVAGFRKVKRLQTLWGEVFVPALGCHAVIAESTRIGGVMWRYWCDECAPNSGAKARAQARRHKQLVDEIHRSRLRRR